MARSATTSCCTARSPSASAAFIAAIGGVLFVWWNGHIDPASIDLGATIDVLVIAVIGGLYRLEGAWLGAFVFVVLNNYSQQIGFIGPRFDTLIGAIFLVIVLVSPGGLIGLWERALTLVSGRRRDPPIERRSSSSRPSPTSERRRRPQRRCTCMSASPVARRHSTGSIKEEDRGMSRLSSEGGQLVPLAALAAVDRRDRRVGGDRADRGRHADQDRRHVGLPGRVRLVRQPGSRRRRHRDVAVRRWPSR